MRTNKVKRIVLISDLQIPYHDPIATRNLVRFIAKWKPHQVATVGDEIDLPQLSKWEREIDKYQQIVKENRATGELDHPESSIINLKIMLIVKVDKNSNIERALKEYKGKIIKTRQSSKLTERKEFVKKSVKKRNVLNKAKYVQKKYKNNPN